MRKRDYKRSNLGQDLLAKDRLEDTELRAKDFATKFKLKPIEYLLAKL